MGICSVAFTAKSLLTLTKSKILEFPSPKSLIHSWPRQVNSTSQSLQFLCNHCVSKATQRVEFGLEASGRVVDNLPTRLPRRRLCQGFPSRHGHPESHSCRILVH